MGAVRGAGSFETGCQWSLLNVQSSTQLLTFTVHNNRPDMTFAVAWALKTNYLSIYLSTNTSILR